MKKIFYRKEVDLTYSEFDIKPLLRGFSKDDFRKVIFIQQAKEGNIKTLFKQIVNGLKVKNLIFQLWNNHLGYESF